MQLVNKPLGPRGQAIVRKSSRLLASVQRFQKNWQKRVLESWNWKKQWQEWKPNVLRVSGKQWIGLTTVNLAVYASEGASVKDVDNIQ